VQSTITYNPYNMKDFEKIKKQSIKDMPKGLGANIGDENW
jgi:hypothetical protein